MLGETKINIEILVGLPGSGKTYYATHMEREPNVWVRHIDLDEYHPVHPGISAILKKHGIYYEVFMLHHTSLLIFDGLLTTNVNQEKIVDEWIDIFNSEDPDKMSSTNIKFIFFKENREACLRNDSFRDKERSAYITIKQMPLERPNIEKLKEKYNDKRFTFEIEEKEVHEMTQYEGTLKPLKNKYWSKKLGYDTMTSDSWRTGGEICSYDGWSSEVEPEKAPQCFAEFDDLLEKLCPNISFLTYKKIYNECVTIQDDYEQDYYGGTQYYSVYCCNLDRLYEMLKERGYLD